MLYWSILFLGLAAVAGLFGFGGIALAAAGIAEVLCYVFLGLAALSLVLKLGDRSR